MEGLFVNRPGMAADPYGLQSADTSPDDGSQSPVVPVDAPVELPAFTAFDHLGEVVAAGVGALDTVGAGVHHAPSGKLLLHQQEDVLRDDGLVVVFHVVLRHQPVVLHPRLRQEVRGVGLLEQGIAHVLLVGEDLLDGARVPAFLSSTGQDVVAHELCGDLVHACTLEVLAVMASSKSYLDFILNLTQRK